MNQHEIIVLLIDNDRDFLNTRAESVRKAGYQVLRAYSLKEARERLMNERVHVVVTDVRLVNDDDDRDTTGITVAKDGQFHSIPKIVLTGFPSFQGVREVMGPREATSSPSEGMPPAIYYLAKDEGPAAMIEAIQVAVERHVKLNWDLNIRLNERLSFAQLGQRLDSEASSRHLLARSQELEDLFRRLFVTQTQITIDELFVSTSTYVALKVFAFNENGRESGFIVSCGLAPVIRETRQRYRAAAIQHFGGLSLDEGMRAETVHYAAAAYRFMGTNLADITTLRQFQRHRPAEAVETALNNLYQECLSSWYEKGRQYQDKPLADHYSEWLDAYRLSLGMDEFQAQVQSLSNQLLTQGIGHCAYEVDSLYFQLPDNQSINLPNPVTLVEDGSFKKISQVPWGLTHGRVNLQTVLVSPEGRCWLIDFSQVGQAPLLQDFVSLEVALKMEWLGQQNLLTCYLVEQRLVGLADLKERIAVEGLPGSVVGLLRQIQLIRRQASLLTDCSMLAYQTGLFFHALAQLSHYQPEVRYLRRELMPYAYSLLAAAVISPALTVAQPPPLPLPIEASGHELWLDANNRTLWVQGKSTRLPPMEYRVLVYLYNHPNQLCAKQDIIQQGLGEPYDEFDREQSRLTTLISRLRRRIEPDKNKPQFLHTIHSYGYKLTLNPSP